MQVLSDPVQRLVYDEIHGHALTAINPFFDDSSPRDHAFVDEFSCIGMCKVFISGHTIIEFLTPCIATIVIARFSLTHARFELSTGEQKSVILSLRNLTG